MFVVYFRYTKMITIGRPRNISNTKGYSNFDISHLVVYFRSVTEMEMSILPSIAMTSGTEKDITCCEAKRSMWFSLHYLSRLGSLIFCVF